MLDQEAVVLPGGLGGKLHFPEAWRRAGRENARPALWDFWSTIGGYLTSEALAGIEVPVVCSYGERSPESLFRF